MSNSVTETGHLGPELSTYLLRHKDSLVNWYGWGEEALAKAKKENKLLFISIGYSACQWCAKMSKLCFVDNEKIAKLFNEHFVPIMADRDLRPDLDHYYSNAIQTLNQNSGWPITCFALPDGTPVFGATYLEPEQLFNIAEGLYETYTIEPSKVQEAGEELRENLAFVQVQQKEEERPMSLRDIHLILEPWKRKFDNVSGGTLHPPKFPLSGGKEFLLECAYYFNDMVIQNHLALTLDCMAKGGIYDQINGGFFRYSTDVVWKKPHFEKLLGDNAQLIGLYAKGHQVMPSPLYKKVVEETLQFCLRSLLAPEGGFYTSMSADTQGEDGLFYTWTESEVRGVLGADAELAIRYYGLSAQENPEDRIAPSIDVEPAALCKEFGLTAEEVADKLAMIKLQLMKAIRMRPQPDVSAAIVASSNALISRSLIIAYRALAYEEYAFLANETLSFIRENMIADTGELYHCFQDGKPMGKGFLDDYSYTINAFLHMFLLDGDDKWLFDAKRLIDYVLVNFYDTKTGMLLYCPAGEAFAQVQTMPIADGTLPSPSSYMAHNLNIISLLLDDATYNTNAQQMLCNMKSQIAGSGPYCATWARLMLRNVLDLRTVGVVGKNAKEVADKLSYGYRPDLLVAFTEGKSNVPFFKNMPYEEGETIAYLSVGNQPRKRITRLEELESLLDLHRI